MSDYGGADANAVLRRSGCDYAAKEICRIRKRHKVVPKDDTEAVKWFRKSAALGFPEGQVDLGECFAKGRGVTNDWEEAVKWFSRAAESGNHRHRTE
jgi:TPR repeat protein